MKRTWRKVKMIDDPYYGKPYVLMFAVTVGFICLVVIGVYCIVGLVDLIMYLIEKI